jgi:FlaA1/EpsC-like NDP-sugar epimerase
MEGNPGEAIKNNIFGTYNVASKAVEYNVDKFILISTDKAVNPTNIMGASKRVTELVVRQLNKLSETKLAAVRFGNVLGSNGSVIPIFKKQIAAGGPITVTHPEIERYFMTIPEAVSLVLQAGLMAKGGEIFELDMGKPMKIYDLACEMIRLSGLEPEVDIKIEFTGLRPGEKLFEELNLDTENLMKTENEKIFLCNFAEDTTDYLNKIEHLKEIVDSDNKNQIAQRIKDIVKEYTSVTFELNEEPKSKTEINKISLDDEPI